MYNIQPKTSFCGKNLKYLPTCHSTNDELLKMIHSSSNFVIEGAVIATDFQTAGRGQRGNTWESKAGENMIFSMVLKPNFLQPMQQFQLNMVVSLALYDFLIFYGNEDIKIKWPNDMYFQNKKIAGILIENVLMGNSINYSVIGVGLNINQTLFQNTNATSLRCITGQPFDYSVPELLSKLLESIENRYLQLQNGYAHLVKSDYLKALFRLNIYSFFKDSNGEFEAKITEIDEYGRLVVETQLEERIYDFKEIQFVL
ncbi:MAG: biotin--[acetyl-CoA-carboxylase] ligase [Pseudarcicella sp.]|nr:biotin--[acetyl-CoA-carboxylase] ligase [Pseudarcicella sp.]MBP6410460.1 biotin--[acetyl-CoA-carboxylase] ligase [Pseudarcicella sp.]